MELVELKRANCRFCGYLCGLVAKVKDGQVIAIEPDPTRFPYDASIQRGCLRCNTNLEFLNHPDRVNYPLKRIGQRGSGKWQQVTWDEALDEIAQRLEALKKQFGPETLATSIGGPHTTFWPLHRFMNLFGSPNNMGIGQICWNPGIWINTLTYGWTIENELDPEKTACSILWGNNFAESDNSLFWRTILQYRKQGKNLIVVDPKYTTTARYASIWLPVRPGADAYLALAMINVILSEKLYNREFVKNWCYGFDQLSRHVAPFTASEVEAVTGISAEKIAQAARLYAKNAPASIIPGRGIDQIGSNSIATHRSIAILRAITGNIDLPGASHVCEMPDFSPEVDLELNNELPDQQRQKQLNRDWLLLQSYSGYAILTEYTQNFGKRLPMRYMTSAHPNLVWHAMLYDKPYPIRALIVMASNPLLTQADTQLVYRALKSLDLLVVLDYFKSPTAMLADFILPVAGGLERPVFQTHAGTANIAYGGEQAVEPYFQRQTDFTFWRELAHRMGQADYWPWETFHDSLQDMLAPAQITWEEFCDSGFYYQPSPYFKHEQINADSGQKEGFATPSGKIELYSEILNALGYPPLPEPTPPIIKEGELFLITGRRKQPYYASSYRQFASLRAIHPKPWAEMNLSTANKLNLVEGQTIYVETNQGKARFIVKIAEMRDDVVSIEYGWWYPELPAQEPELGGLWISNANILTNADIQTSDRLIGTWTYNGLSCKVSVENKGDELVL